VFLPGAMISALPIGLLLWLDASGFVFLFGGVRAWKSASFGLALLLLVNPVPGSVNNLFDLKLQYLSARLARGFATMLGMKPAARKKINPPMMTAACTWYCW